MPAALLTQKFWIQAIYTELLRASSRHKAVREHEKQRPPTGLIKIVCLPFDSAAAQKHGRRNVTDARFETMLGEQLGGFLVCLVSCIFDALGSRSHSEEKLRSPPSS